GMGSKENMAVAPLLAIFYDRHFLSSSWKEVFRRRGWLYIAMAVTVAWPLSRQWMFSPHLQPGVVTPDVMRRYWLTQAWGLTRLWRLVVWPAPLVFDYGTLLASGLREVLPHLVVVLLVVGATFWAGVRRPRAGFAGLCFFGLLAPSLLLPITGQPIAEHRLYAPMAALIALFVAGCIQLGRRAHWDSRVGSAALALATLLLGGASFHRNTTYRSGIALMEDVIAKRPGNGRAWQNLGVFLQAAGQMDQALEAYSRALLLNPSDKRALSNRALLRFQQGQWNPALADLNRWLQLAPDSADALIRRAVVWTRLGDPVRAEQDYGRALASGNATAPQLNNLAWLLATTERILDPPRAIELAQRAVDISGRDYRTLDTLAVAYAAAGEFEQARAITIEARDRARARKDAAFAAKLEGRLERYRKNHPWRED
ncbi:MAG: tetratricopeptide repeat protein, partial [Verrucomicrobia bacterium]|nr:tetratricopeptide repeat protein [Verrucomicrobiota bacterium]